MPSNGIRLLSSNKLANSPVGFGKTLMSFISINGKLLISLVCERINREKKTNNKR